MKKKISRWALLLITLFVFLFTSQFSGLANSQENLQDINANGSSSQTDLIGPEYHEDGPQYADCEPVAYGYNQGESFFAGTLALMNIPLSDFAVQAFMQWKPYENTAACWNPLATTYRVTSMPPGTGCTATNFNTVPVQNYSSEYCGKLATALTLNLSYYAAIRTMLKQEAFNWQAIHDSIIKWVGSEAYATAITNKWQDLWNNGADPITPIVCPPPSNGLPRDGKVLNNNTVTFSWSPPSCTGLDYYTFRVANHADIDNPPWIFNYGLASNATSHTQTIPTSYNGQTLYWAIWPHNSAGYGSKGGPWSFKIDTSSPPQPPPLPTGTWTVQYFNNKELTSPCNDPISIDSTFIFRDWGDGAPASGCNTNHWGARFTRQVFFSGGRYDFAVEADDWARIFVDGNLVVNKWDGATQHYEGYDVNAGNHEVKVEFADTEGAAKVSAWWWGPGFNVPHDAEDFSQWHANYWLNPTQWWDAYAKVNEGTGVLNHNWGYDDPGWDMPSDNFSAKFRRTQYFECGTYRFVMSHDDGAKFWLDDVLKVDRWSGAIGNYEFTLPITRGTHLLQVDMYENGGAANIYFNWEQISNCAPSTPSLKYPSDSSSLAWYSDLTLQWNAVPDATQYLVQLSGGPGVNISSGWLSSTQWHLGGLWPGTYTWSVTSRNDYGSSTPSTTWTFEIESVPSLSDIVVESITPSSYTPTLNGPVTFTVRIKNQGAADVTSGFYVDLFLDTEPGGCGSDGIHWWRLESLAVGASTDLTITHDGFDTSGAHSVYVFADSYCEITEDDDSNNIYGPVVINVKESVPSLPDIVVESITPSTNTPSVNELVTFTVRIKNQGAGDVDSGFYVGLFIDKAPSVCGLVSGVLWWEIQSLASGASIDLTVANGFDTIGPHTAYAFADSDCIITEADDTNNISGPVVIDVKESTPNRNIYLPIIITPPQYQTVPFGLGNPYFEMTFDTSKWEAGPLRLGNVGYYHLFSRNYPDCYIDDLWQHDWDPSRFYRVDTYENHANISFHFQVYYRTGTTNPAFSIIKWGPDERYIIQIVSIDSINADWSCFNEGKEVLWLSADRGFD